MKEELKQAIQEAIKSDININQQTLPKPEHDSYLFALTQLSIKILSTPSILRHADPEIMKQAGWVGEDGSIGINDRENRPIKEGDILLVRDNGAWGVVVWKAPFYEVTVDEHQSSLYSREFLQQSLIMGNIKTHKLPTSDLIQFKSVCGNLYCQDMLLNGENSVCCGRAIKMIPTPLEPIQQPPKQ